MIGEKITLEEDLSLTFGEEYQVLLKTIRFTEGFSLLFVECSPAQGTKIMEKIRLDIRGKRAEVLPLDKTVYNFYNLVKEFPNLKKIDILFVTGLEHSLYEYEDEMRERGWDDNEIISISRRGVPPILINLNQQRERFRDNFDICFVFLLPRFAMDYLINRAPDFFDWRSGVFQFPTDKEIFDEEFLKVDAKELEDYIELPQQECKDELLKIKSLLDENPSPKQKVNLLVIKAVIEIQLKQNEEAILSCDEALKIEQNNYDAWYNKGIALRNLERYEEAIAAFDKALEIKPDHYKAWYHKGIAMSDLGRYKQAISAYDKAIEIKPYFHEAWNGKGEALFYLDKYKQAIYAFDKALEIKPDDYYAWTDKGIILNYLDKYEKAIYAFDKALEIKPDYEGAWYSKGMTLRNSERNEEASAAFENALKIKPNYYKAWHSKGIMLMILAIYEEAIAAFDKALEIKPDDYIAWACKGYSLSCLGKYEEAIESCDKALEIKPDYEEAWYFRGGLLWRLLRFKEGYVSIMKGREINPYFPVDFLLENIKRLPSKRGWRYLKEFFTKLLRIIVLKR